MGGVLFHPEREDRLHVVPHPVLGGLRLEAELDRALRQDLDESEAVALHLQIERLFNGAPRMRAPLVVVEGDPFHIEGPVQARDQLRHLERLSREERPALGRCRGSLAEQGGGRHLAAGHPVDGVVDEHDRDRDPELCRADDLGEPDRGQVAVSLVADHDRVRVRRLVADRHRGRPPVRRLGVADVEVVVHEDRAADRRDEDGAVLNPELVDGLGEVLLGQPVPAAGAVCRGVGVDALAVTVTLELAVEDRSRHQRTPSKASTCSTISPCEGRMPPMRRTWLMGGGWIPAWLSARRSSSSSCPLLASTTTRRLVRPSTLERASIGKGHSVTGRKQADPETLFPQLSYGALGELGGRVAGHEHAPPRRRSDGGRPAARRR